MSSPPRAPLPGHISSLIPNPSIVGDSPTLDTATHDASTVVDHKEMHKAAEEQLAAHHRVLAAAAAAAHPPEPMQPIHIPQRPVRVFPKAILVAVDQSEQSRQALLWALDNFAGEHVVLHVVCCFPAAVDSMMPEDERERQLAEQVTAEEIKLAEWVADASNASASKLSLHASIAVGDPTTELCRLAEALDVRVVVVGSRGMGALRKALLGSVSEYLTHHCSRPVLVVRTPADAPQ
eukprot:m.121739 g.121739  ORF g.121739 m.121739 type:complete len:236 (+) comp14585_c2_seq1:123-830(+)